MSDFISLSYVDLAVGSVLLLLNAGLSLRLQLGLEKDIIVSALRMTVQLMLVGLVLKALFATTDPWLTLLAMLIMGAFAGREIMARQRTKFTGWWRIGLGSTTMMIAGMLVIVLGLSVQVQPDPWYDPRYAIPMFGMILGNTMTGVSLGLNTLTTNAVRSRRAIEGALLLGCTRWVAFRPVTREALVSGMMPVINQMAAAGVVSLPGMMTGQILAGIDPTEAVKYQLLIMFLIAGSTGSGVLMAVFGGVWRLSDERHRLRLDRLQR
ncbi:MAG: iron export ABC transporter permease subunit FetB [Alphaproteobacteria bacterium]